MTPEAVPPIRFCAAKQQNICQIRKKTTSKLQAAKSGKDHANEYQQFIQTRQFYFADMWLFFIIFVLKFR
jgi:hypothetical protein